LIVSFAFACVLLLFVELNLKCAIVKSWSLRVRL